MVTPSVPTSWWDNVQNYVGKAEAIADTPIYDAAAVFDVEATVIAGILLGIKMLTLGYYYTQKRRY